ncbi:hypothetical protein [Streptomyces sp. NPDC005805]|uniref:hypothetical protein n=1 Tax=Streptomyces sp. NPDC005805 TaxID=3157068 RepID=UPI0033F00FD5
MRSREYDLDFRDRATRRRSWGAGLLALAGLLWVWCAVLLLTPYQAEEPGDDDPVSCESRLLTDGGTANQGVRSGTYCAAERDWPEALFVLGLSFPVALAGTGLFTAGTVARQMSAHAEAMRELDTLADRS